MTKRRNYIGLATSAHDTAIAIVNPEGRLVFAESAERFLQNKRGWNSQPDDCNRIPELVAQYCEPEADLVIGTTWSRKACFMFRVMYAWGLPLLKFIGFFGLKGGFYERLLVPLKATAANGRIAGGNLTWRYLTMWPGAKVTKIACDHHSTHAVAACYGSPYREAVCAVVDGSGEDSTVAFFSYKDGRVKRLRGIRPSRFCSLGIFYQFLCMLCGFEPTKGEEWKVMGLAAYGEHDEEIYQLCRSLFRVKGCRLIGPRISKMMKIFRKLMKSRRTPGEPALKAANIAFSGQKVFSEVFAELLTNLHKRAHSDNLVLSGGCALNSAFNGTILERTPFRDLYMFPAPADDGCAVGAALMGYRRHNPAPPPPARLLSPYLGEGISRQTLERLKKFGGLENALPPGKKVHERAAELLAEGKIIGWVQGRAEFGPRALGNRSILADPRSPKVKDQLNARVKFREEFRPFAPSILHEYGDEYFEDYQESPYMERALRFRAEVRDRVPGVVHVDGTGRLQTVKREWNEKFYNLISAFHELTGIPLVLNTSFNKMGKPIMHTVEDALGVFFTTGLDALVIEDQLYEKKRP